MNTQVNLRFLWRVSIGVLLSCAGIFFWTQWDLKRFQANLGDVPNFKASLNPPPQEDMQIPEQAEVPAPSVTESHEGVLEAPEELQATETVTETQTFAETDPYVAPFIEELEESTDFDELLQESVSSDPNAPYDVAMVERGFSDYNAFLSIHPELAYQRLAEALREQYGNYSEIDVIVEAARRVNNGTITIDDAIDMREATLRITPANEPETIQVISQSIEYLSELRALEAEGEPIEFQFNIHFGE